MAGIGITLRKILAEESFTAVARAYALGAALSIGPFLSSVVCLAALAALSVGVAELDVRQAFSGATVYVFGGSLVATSAMQVILTRYLADEIYCGAHETLVESFFGMLVLAAGLLTIVALPVLWVVQISVVAKVILLSLHITIGAVWIAVLYTSAASGHHVIAAAFVVGSTVAFVAGYALLPRFGLEGLLFGYAFGHFVILALLINLLMREFGRPARWDWGALKYVTAHPALIAIGLLQTLGFWIDKFMFWGSDLSVEAAGFVTAPKYDSSTFLGFLTAVPAIVHFFVRIEADFSERFHEFFDRVFFRSSLDEIRAAATTLREAVLTALRDIFLIQGVITFVCAFFGVEILSALGLPLSQIGIYRFSVIGALFLVFMLFTNVMLLYLDCQRQALISCATFFAVNVVLTAVSQQLGYPFYGLGFAAAALCGLATSLVQLMDQLYNLERMTFISKPIVGQHRAQDKLRARPGGGYGRYHLR